mgnify:CR=1 FL=1
MAIVYKTDFRDLRIPHTVRRGKVRDIYEMEDSILFIASDRISAFDVVMDDAIPEKGKVLSVISAFWFEKTQHIIKNHFISNNVDDYPEDFRKYREQLEGRSMLVKKCRPLPLEAIVRGYIAGSGWKEYKKSKTVCGIPLPDGLQEFSKFSEPLYTPSTKAEEGHDINISYEEASKIVGDEMNAKVSKASLDLYNFGAEYLEKRGIILPDTKFEFGLDENNELILIDEALTPDSSRFWDKSVYQPGKPQLNFDKQILRDYLESLDWNKQPPPPPLPQEIITGTTEKYLEALRLIVNS